MKVRFAVFAAMFIAAGAKTPGRPADWILVNVQTSVAAAVR